MAIYPSARDFRAAVEDALYRLQYADAVTSSPARTINFAPAPQRPLAPGPHHRLDRLMDEMLEAGRAVLGSDSPLPHAVPVEWSPRPLKGWCGGKDWVPGLAPWQGAIRINRKLDSPDVPADMLRFVLQHAYLHLYLQQGHRGVFRELEWKWPGTD